MGQQLPTIMFLSLLSTMLSLGIWTRFARRVGKNQAFQVCIVWSIVVLSVFPLLRADMPRQLFYLFIVFCWVWRRRLCASGLNSCRRD